MATYHFSLKQGKVGKAKMHCDYINREGRYANGKMKEELVYKESGNLPIWAKSATDFFAKADVFERANGNAYTEFEMALPAEISLDENIKLVKEFVKKHVGENKVYAFAIHEKMAALNPTQRQPHVHLMFSERVIDDKNKCKPAVLFFKRYNSTNPEKGGYFKDNRFWKNKYQGGKNINYARRDWAKFINAAYAKKGLSHRVTSLSLREQRELANKMLSEKVSDKRGLTFIWAKFINAAYAKKGLSHRVTSLSLREQRELANKMLSEKVSDKRGLTFIEGLDCRGTISPEKQREIDNIKLSEKISDKKGLTFIEAHLDPQMHLGPKLANQMQKIIEDNPLYLQFLPDKAQLYFIQKEIEETKKQIVKQQEFIKQIHNEKEKLTDELEHLKNETDDFKGRVELEKNDEDKDRIKMSGAVLIAKIYKAINDIQGVIEDNDKHIKELYKNVFSDERLDRIALSIYTKGATTRYQKEFRKLKEQREKFEIEFKEFQNLPLPKYFEHEKKAEYDSKKARLMQWQKDILDSEKNFAYRNNILKQELNRPERQQQIAEIRRILAEKNEKNKESLELLKQENKECRYIGRQLLHVNKSLNKGMRYLVKNEHANIINDPTNNISSLKKILDDMKSSSYQLRDAKDTKENNMIVKLHDNQDEKNDIDIGI